VGLLAGDQELGGAGVRVERVGGDDRAGQVQAGQPCTERRRQRGCVHTLERAADDGLTGHRPAIGASRRAPSAARTGGGASAAHSAIAVIDRAPVSTAAAAMARIAASVWRRPLVRRGSWMVAR
jgi:hypothetical protein